MSPPEQTTGAAGATPPKTGKRRPIYELAGIGPVWREQIARWIDAHLTGFENQIVILSQMMANGQEFAGCANQLAYFRVAVSVLKQLSWEMRTGRGGPLSGGKRQKKQS